MLDAAADVLLGDDRLSRLANHLHTGRVRHSVQGSAALGARGGFWGGYS
jgi:hypothetical protein